MIELYRAIVPVNHIINDNHGQHYKVHMGNIEYLTEQFESILRGEREVSQGRGRRNIVEPYSGPGGFGIPDLDAVKKAIDFSQPRIIRCEVWKPRNLRFDPQNYAKTFKAPIDMLTKYGYIPDDSWRYVKGIMYYGGGPSVWADRAVRFENDGLPGELTLDWWDTVATDPNDILIRIIVE